MLHLHGFAWVTGNITSQNFKIVSSQILTFAIVWSLTYVPANGDFDGMWAEEYKDGHPDLDRFVDKP
jgi:hypothetical protein